MSFLRSCKIQSFFKKSLVSRFYSSNPMGDMPHECILYTVCRKLLFLSFCRKLKTIPMLSSAVVAVSVVIFLMVWLDIVAFAITKMENCIYLSMAILVPCILIRWKRNRFIISSQILRSCQLVQSAVILSANSAKTGISLKLSNH